MTQPTVSIAMLTCNHPKFLRSALDSVIARSLSQALVIFNKISVLCTCVMLCSFIRAYFFAPYIIEVFIGYDPRETVVHQVFSNSIIRHASAPLSLPPLALNSLSGYK